MTCYSMIQNSLIEYPGEISMVVFYGNCDAKCPHCHNRDRIGGMSVQDVLTLMEKKREYVTAAVLTGGEMTMSPDVAVFAEKAKSLGLKVKLHTNGSRPTVVGAIRGYFDRIDIDIKTTPDKYYGKTGIGWESVMGTMMAAGGLPIHLHTTVCPDMIAPDDVKTIIDMIGRGSFVDWVFQECRGHGHEFVDVERFRQAVLQYQ